MNLYEEMTPHELNLHIQEYNSRINRDSEEQLTLAYLTAHWQRVKRMPQLRELLERVRPKQVLDDEQLLAQVKALNAAMGGKTKVRERGEA